MFKVFFNDEFIAETFDFSEAIEIARRSHDVGLVLESGEIIFKYVKFINQLYSAV